MVVAKNTQFDVDEITAEAGEARHVDFDNEDEVLHNIAVYAGEGAGRAAAVQRAADRRRRDRVRDGDRRARRLRLRLRLPPEHDG